MTNGSLGLLKISLAYKLTMAAMGLSEANYVATQLNLPCHKPIAETNVIHRFVAPPGLGEPKLPTTTLETSNYWFCFRHGKLSGVANTKTNIEEVEHYKEWAKMPSLIGTNEAYRLATQWLSAISVDIPALERRYKAQVGQPFFWGDQGTNQVFLPIYYVTWGNPHVVSVGIFGPTKELMDLRIEDSSFLTRTNLFLPNDVELNNIPDPPKKKLVLPSANQQGPLGKLPAFVAPGLASERNNLPLHGNFSVMVGRAKLTCKPAAIMRRLAHTAAAHRMKILQNQKCPLRIILISAVIASGMCLSTEAIAQSAAQVLIEEAAKEDLRPLLMFYPTYDWAVYIQFTASRAKEGEWWSGIRF